MKKNTMKENSQQFPLKMNLQLFAGEKSVTVDGQTFEIDDNDAGQYADTDNEPILEADEEGITIPDDDDTEVTDEDGEEEKGENAESDDDGGEEDGTRVLKDEKQDRNPTANAVIMERRKWQERVKELEKQAKLAQKLMKLAGINDPDSIQQQLDAYEAQLLQKQKGLDPQTAQFLVQQQRQLEEMRQDIQRQKFDVEAVELKKDPFFADIDDWRDELEPIALKSGLTLKQAYMAVRGPERMKEYQRELELRMQANQAKKQSARVNATANGGNAKKGVKVQLTPEELAIAKLAGIKPEEYYKFKKK